MAEEAPSGQAKRGRGRRTRKEETGEEGAAPVVAVASGYATPRCVHRMPWWCSPACVGAAEWREGSATFPVHPVVATGISSTRILLPGPTLGRGRRDTSAASHVAGGARCECGSRNARSRRASWRLWTCRRGMLAAITKVGVRGRLTVLFSARLTAHLLLA